MAKQAWLKATPSSGNGNGIISVESFTPHTGRVLRTSTLTVTAAGVPDNVATINQAGKVEFVTIQSTATSPKEGGSITISGTSNSQKLNFTLGTGTLAITIPSSYLANSVNTNNNVNISGDPGAVEEFPFSISITVPQNATTETLTKQLIVTTSGSQTSTCTISQTAGSPTLSITPTTINLDAQGTVQTITVTSNTAWTVE